MKRVPQMSSDSCHPRASHAGCRCRLPLTGCMSESWNWKPIEHAAFRGVASKHARDGDGMRNIEAKAHLRLCSQGEQRARPSQARSEVGGGWWLVLQSPVNRNQCMDQRLMRAHLGACTLDTWGKGVARHELRWGWGGFGGRTAVVGCDCHGPTPPTQEAEPTKADR
jgi:hypothetical protein